MSEEEKQFYQIHLYQEAEEIAEKITSQIRDCKSVREKLKDQIHEN